MNVAYVPLRSGSKRVKDKNIKELNGKPLFYWNIKALEDSDNIDIIYVGIDSEKYASIVFSFDFKKVEVYARSDEDSRDEASIEEGMINCIKEKEINKNDVFMLVQVTTPFLTSSIVDNAISFLLLRQNDSIISVCEFDRFIWSKIFHKPVNYDLFNRQRTQSFNNKLLIENGMFYLSFVKDILNSKNRISGSIGYYTLPDYCMYEIDTELDFKIVKTIHKEIYKNGQ